MIVQHIYWGIPNIAVDLAQVYVLSRQRQLESNTGRLRLSQTIIHLRQRMLIKSGMLMLLFNIIMTSIIVYVSIIKSFVQFNTRENINYMDLCRIIGSFS